VAHKHFIDSLSLDTGWHINTLQILCQWTATVKTDA